MEAFIFRNNLNLTELSTSPYSFAHFQSEKFIKELYDIIQRYDKIDQNYHGCLVKPNPRLFPFHVYWTCVNRLSPILLYFPYLVLTMALILVLLERLLTRYMWTGQRIEKFYNLLVKDVMDSGDIDKVDTKENRQNSRQLHYDFKGSWFYSKAYTSQTAIKLILCLIVITFSVFDQCKSLRDSFKPVFEGKVFDYTHECSIPSNMMNMVIFDLVNIVLFLIFVLAAYNLSWHRQFRRFKTICPLDSKEHGFLKRKVTPTFCLC